MDLWKICEAMSFEIFFALIFSKIELVKEKIILVWDSITKNEIRQIEAPICVEGIKCKDISSKGHNGHCKAIEFQPSNRPEEFTPSTVIINGGHAIWELPVPKRIRDKLIDMTLKIETVRTHGMLHSPNYRTSASIYINDELIDRIVLVKPHPHGEDYGVNSRRPIPVYRFINRKKNKQLIKIVVDENAKWDIDRITFEPIVLTKTWKPEMAMIIGACISAFLGYILYLIAK
ncbi:MAG: hypothetical protein GY869_31055 [Planctomycetes bacterium]|nr:hypothetical protein [Planctomycetota bacterium]